MNFGGSVAVQANIVKILIPLIRRELEIPLPESGGMRFTNGNRPGTSASISSYGD